MSCSRTTTLLMAFSFLLGNLSFIVALPVRPCTVNIRKPVLFGQVPTCQGLTCLRHAIWISSKHGDGATNVMRSFRKGEELVFSGTFLPVLFGHTEAFKHSFG